MNINNLTNDFDSQTKTRLQRYSFAAMLILLVFVSLLIFNLYVLGSFEFKFWKIYTTVAGWQFIFHGILNTFKVALVDACIAAIAGLLIALGQLSTKWSICSISTGYSELFRGTPTLLLILFLYFGVGLGQFWAIVFGSALYNSAALSNIFKSGILSLQSGQAEAAYSLGFGYGNVMRLIVLPQAIFRMMPSLVAQFVVLMKDSSLGFFIGYQELLRSSQLIASYSHNYLQAYFVAGLIYLVLCFGISRFGDFLTHKLNAI